MPHSPAPGAVPPPVTEDFQDFSPFQSHIDPIIVIDGSPVKPARPSWGRAPARLSLTSRCLMEKPPARLIPLLTAAADLRAAGCSWATVADKPQRDADTCRHWPRRYPDAWKRLYRQAEDLMLHQAGAEAVATLRGLLVDPDPKVRLGASRALLRAQAGARALEGPPGPEPPDDGFRAYLPYLRTLSDAELVARVRSYLNDPDAEDDDDDYPPPPARPVPDPGPPDASPPQAVVGFTLVEGPPASDLFGQQTVGLTPPPDGTVIVAVAAADQLPAALPVEVDEVPPPPP